MVDVRILAERVRLNSEDTAGATEVRKRAQIHGGKFRKRFQTLFVETVGKHIRPHIGDFQSEKHFQLFFRRFFTSS